MSGGQGSGWDRPAAAARQLWRFCLQSPPAQLRSVLCGGGGGWDTPLPPPCPASSDQSQLLLFSTPPVRGRAWTLGSGGKVTWDLREVGGGEKVPISPDTSF